MFEAECIESSIVGNNVHFKIINDRQIAGEFSIDFSYVTIEKFHIFSKAILEDYISDIDLYLSEDGKDYIHYNKLYAVFKQKDFFIKLNFGFAPEILAECFAEMYLDEED
jgi:cyclopropane fatty-acyl-phospholipid synthase-like methyltransferase